MPKKKKRARKKYRRNPSSRGKAIVRRARSGIAGLNFKSAFKNSFPMALGMFATKFAAKRGGGALEDDRASWDGMSYVKGGLGAVAAAFIANMIKPGTGQKLMDGSLAFLWYKALQNHVIPKNNFLMNQLGASDSSYQPGDVEVNSAGEPFILGDDGQWIPIDEGDSGAGMLGGYGYEDDPVLEPPGRLGYYGDVLEPPGRLGADTREAYRRTLFDR